MGQNHDRSLVYAASGILAVVIGFAPLAGCSSMTIAAKEKFFGIAKRDQLVARVKDVRSSQGDAKEEFQSALDQLLAFSGGTGTDLETKYKKLQARYDDAKGAADKVSARIGKAQDVAGALFTEWQKEIGTYTNQSMKSESQTKLDETKGQYNQLLGVMKQSEAKMAPVLDTFRQQVLFLKHNLNAQAISSMMQKESGAVQTEVQRLITDLQSSIAEADTFISQMKK